MKNTILILAIAATAVACGGKQETTSDHAAADTLLSEGTNSKAAYDRADTVEVGGERVTYHVVLMPTDSLPTVKDYNGRDHQDRKATIVVERANGTQICRTLTKQAVEDMAEATFFQSAILDGMRLAEVTSKGLRFVMSISEPNSDLTQPFSLMLTLDGGMTITPQTIIDVE